jgi:hypothetical protein
VLAGGKTTAVAVNRPDCSFNERMCMLMPAAAAGWACPKNKEKREKED